MNDLTKEELQLIVNGLSWWLDDSTECRLDVLDKLQALIDNYCDHKENVCIGGWVGKCTKCGMKFGDETQ